MIPKKLIKLSKNMRVDTITKQNKKSFAPLCFGEIQSKEERNLATSASPKRAPSLSSSKNNNATRKRKANRRKTKENNNTRTKPTPKQNPNLHNYNPLITALCALLDRKEHDEKQCDNNRLFKIYNRRVLGRVEKICQELAQLEGVESELSWVQKSFLPFLNNFAIYYSHVCKDL